MQGQGHPRPHRRKRGLGTNSLQQPHRVWGEGVGLPGVLDTILVCQSEGRRAELGEASGSYGYPSLPRPLVRTLEQTAGSAPRTHAASTGAHCHLGAAEVLATGPNPTPRAYAALRVMGSDKLPTFSEHRGACGESSGQGPRGDLLPSPSGRLVWRAEVGGPVSRGHGYFLTPGEQCTDFLQTRSQCGNRGRGGGWTGPSGPSSRRS